MYSLTRLTGSSSDSNLPKGIPTVHSDQRKKLLRSRFYQQGQIYFTPIELFAVARALMAIFQLGLLPMVNIVENPTLKSMTCGEWWAPKT